MMIPLSQSPPPKPPVKPTATAPERRGFLGALAAVVFGAFVGIVPLGSGLFTFLDPLRKRKEEGDFLKVAPLGAVPDDGVPRQFPVIAQRTDAWTRSLEPIGAVYLRREPGDEKITCWTATCPHAGCFVDYDPTSREFKCPCHNSSFSIDGAIIEPSPSPRAMDTLDCKVDNDAVLVHFENFYTGKTEKIPKT